jgi:hypothetical protein
LRTIYRDFGTTRFTRNGYGIFSRRAFKFRFKAKSFKEKPDLDTRNARAGRVSVEQRHVPVKTDLFIGELEKYSPQVICAFEELKTSKIALSVLVPYQPIREGKIGRGAVLAFHTIGMTWAASRVLRQLQL